MRAVTLLAFRMMRINSGVWCKKNMLPLHQHWLGSQSSLDGSKIRMAGCDYIIASSMDKTYCNSDACGTWQSGTHTRIVSILLLAGACWKRSSQAAPPLSFSLSAIFLLLRPFPLSIIGRSGRQLELLRGNATTKTYLRTRAECQQRRLGEAVARLMIFSCVSRGPAVSPNALPPPFITRIYLLDR